jgi:cytochrome c oxidase subunit 3
VPPGGGHDGGDGDDDFRRGPDPDESALALRRYRLGTWVGLGAVTMFFAAFTSAYVVRKGMAMDWRPIALPPILWLNTALIIASSFTMERARKLAAMRECMTWLLVTAALGVLFVAGQLAAWRQLAASGVYMASNPSSSFFYLLTGTHGLHILGGILALFYVTLSAWRRRFWVRKQAAVEATTIYWHFMDGLWVYLFLLLRFGR